MDGGGGGGGVEASGAVCNDFSTQLATLTVNPTVQMFLC